MADVQTENKPEAETTPATQPVSTPPEDVNMTDLSEKESKTATA